ESCVRMVRADYCGDGTSHTINGTAIDVFDSLPTGQDVQKEATEWPTEAVWSRDNASCVNHCRLDPSVSVESMCSNTTGSTTNPIEVTEQTSDSAAYPYSL